MFILKLEQNLFNECSPKKIKEAEEYQEGESIFRTLFVDFYDSVKKMTVEKRKYPYFFKYYLYWDENLSEPVDFKSEEGTDFLLGFYKKYCPSYLKKEVFIGKENTNGNPDASKKKKRLEDYFETNQIPEEAMQRFVAGGALDFEDDKETSDNQEESAGQKKAEPAPAVSVFSGYHEFNEEEKQDIGSQLASLKAQFADQLLELDQLMKKPIEGKETGGVDENSN
ncbi:MAG: hypothetical protein Q4B70_04060 [Lachnospiraceae bacterium]|nr:hypothetical protein [Lachnospiraceae bacterium]